MATATAKRKKKPGSVSAQSAIAADTWLVISYRRFSSGPQAFGRSEDRQEETFTRFIEQEKRKHPDRHYIFNHLPMDRGFSAFYGEHRKRGHLGKLLQGIEAGTVQILPGRTILFVEEEKRLSREGGKDALQNTIFKLFDAGITLCLNNGMEWNNDLIKKTPGLLGRLADMLDWAYKDSLQKKEWLDDVWKMRREQAAKGVMVTARPPTWLKIVGRTYLGDKITNFGTCEIIPEAGKAIVKMFKLAAQGLSFDSILMQLNDDVAAGGWFPVVYKKDGTPRKSQRRDSWYKTYVQMTLRNRAIVGEYQPHRKIGGKFGKRVPEGDPKKIYPNVLAKHPGLFEKVQKILSAKAGPSQAGRKNHRNPLTGLCKCGYCGGPMHFGVKGRVGSYYLYCQDSNGRREKCPMMPYFPSEEALLDQLPRLNLDGILPKRSSNQKLMTKLRQQEQCVVADADAKQEEVENYLQRIGKTKDEDLQQRYEQEIANRKSEIRDLGKQLAQIRNRLDDASRDANSSKVWQDTLAELKAELAKGNREVRERLNDHLRQFIDHIDLFSKGYPIQFRDGSDGNLLNRFADVEDEFGKLTPKEKRNWEAYMRWARSELRTKRARFMRVYFKQHGYTGADGGIRFMWPHCDIATEGSIAGSGRAADTLWEEFKNRPRKPRPR